MECFLQPIPLETVSAIEQHLHAVMRERAGRLIDKYAVQLPALAAMIAGQATREFGPIHDSPDVWFFPIFKMYGGFRLRWLEGGPDAKLEAVSFCRVASQSGQRHEITATGSVLVESGTH